MALQELRCYNCTATIVLKQWLIVNEFLADELRGYVFLLLEHLKYLENQVNKNKKYILRFFLQSFFAGNVHEGIDVLQLIK